MTAFIICVSFILAVYVNNKYTQYVETREQRRLEALERQFEEARFKALESLMFN